MNRYGYSRVEGDLRKFSDIGAWYAIEDCVQDDKKHSNPTSVISDETIANPNAQIFRDDMVRVQVPRCMAWLDYDEHVDSLRKSVSMGVDISNWEMFDDDWGLESKEVSPLGEELSLFDRPNKVERGCYASFCKGKQLIRMSAGNFSSKTKNEFSHNVKTASQVTRDAVTTTPVIFDEKKLGFLGSFIG
uniref:Uncharacterized protein n=1 Tax=Tanacetum cinerariifolium TaxID=118510 RepID=A0A6L2MG09_TANCI|nr:hypothetical protein [Tanacetum cinerariifolium]